MISIDEAKKLADLLVFYPKDFIDMPHTLRLKVDAVSALKIWQEAGLVEKESKMKQNDPYDVSGGINESCINFLKEYQKNITCSNYKPKEERSCYTCRHEGTKVCDNCHSFGVKWQPKEPAYFKSSFFCSYCGSGKDIQGLTYHRDNCPHKPKEHKPPKKSKLEIARDMHKSYTSGYYDVRLRFLADAYEEAIKEILEGK